MNLIKNYSKFYQVLLGFVFLLTNSFNANASHIIGGTIYYDYLGGTNYRIYISVYRDCLSQGADFDSPLTLGVFRASNNSIYNTYSVSYRGKQSVPVVFNNPCVIAPGGICVESTLYEYDVSLPPIPGGYILSHTRCCRGPEINNLRFPEDQGLTLSATIPGTESNGYQNSSPRFSGYPPLLLCNNDQLVFNHSATDLDGDQLVYSFAAPYQGGTSFNPAPNPPPNPPFVPVNWANNYSTSVPLGPNSSMTIDPQTGVLRADPGLSGRFVVGIRVAEYRNGVLLSSTIRDFVFRVFNCQITMQAILPTQEQLPGFNGFCNGNTNINFVNNSYGGTNYLWNFDDPASGANNTSTVFAPSHNFRDTGLYKVQLIVNPGWPCTDTAFIDIRIYDELNVTHNLPEPQCLVGNGFDLVANSDGPTTTVFNWDFGPNASTRTAVGRNVRVSFNNPGTQTIRLNARHGVCEKEEQFTVVTTPSPEAEFRLSQNYKCEGLDLVVTNASTNATRYFWSFGDGNQSNQTTSLVHSYNNPGAYTLFLRVEDANGACKDSMETVVVVNHPIILDLPPQIAQCITVNEFDFAGEVSGPVGTDYWMTINEGSVQYFDSTRVLGYSFVNAGSHTVTLYGRLGECLSQEDIEVRLIAAPTIDFKLRDGLRCVPFPAEYISLSTSEFPLNYQWDFGNGQFSDEANPLTFYMDSGWYDVSLRIWANEGCLDTLVLVREDFLRVNPKPEATFKVDKEVVDICNSGVQFTSLTVGDLMIQYDFDDKVARSNDHHPFYYFRNDGTHRVQQFVQSKDGCRDTAIIEVYVEPYTIFAPNTFTPDGDEHNNVFEFVVHFEPQTWHAQIFNQWGEMVFESYDVSMPWDGTYNGVIVPDGTYSYVVRYSPCHQKDYDKKVFTGFINILR